MPEPPLPFAWQREGRNGATLIVVSLLWVLLAAAWAKLDAAWWIITPIWLLSLPAVYDIWRNPISGLHLDHTQLSWFTGQIHGQVALEDINHVRLDTRLDLSLRITLVLCSGRHLRLPAPVAPPPEPLETAMRAAGITTRRHHFSLMQ